MNIKKRIVSALMALVMTLSLVNSAVITAFAVGETQTDVTTTGETQTVSEEAQASKDYDLKVVDFEGTYWNALIDDPQYGGNLLYGEGSGFSSADAAYKWVDSDTGLSGTLSEGYGSWCYWSGGEAISNYVSGEIETYGTYEYQLTVYKEGVTGIQRTGGGHSGNNFAVHYGYADTSSGYGLGEASLPRLTFTNGAHVIDHMYVKLTPYLLGCIVSGNDKTSAMGDDDILYLRAIGYDADNMKVSEVKMNVCEGKNLIVKDWTKWDLSSLGAVSSVALEINGSSNNGYGFSQPAYFAYDDVAVRVPHADANNDKKCDTCGADMNKAPTLVEGVTDVTADVVVGTAYLLSDLQAGKIFKDDYDKLSYDKNYFYQKSTDGGKTWSEELSFSNALYGATTISLTETVAGTYIYRFYAKDNDGAQSEDYWTLTLHVDTEENLDFDINFYIGRDQNYNSNGNKLPIIKLWKSDGKSNKVGEEITVTDAEDTKTGYNCMKATVKGGWYVYEGYGWNAETEAYDVSLGGMQLKLPTDSNVDGAAAGGTEIYLRVMSVYVGSRKTDNSCFGEEDYTVRVSCPIMQCDAMMGTPYKSGSYTYYPTLFYAGGNACLFDIYCNPTDTTTYMFTRAGNQTLQAGTGVVTKYNQIKAAVKLTVTVPKTADFGLYFQYNNFYTAQQKPLVDWKDNEDGTRTAVYSISQSNSNYTWRLTDPTGTYVTKAGWLNSVSKDAEVSFDFTDGQTNKLSHDFSKLGTQTSKRDEADLQVFVSASGAKALGSATERIRAYRMWELIDSDAGNIMLEPDYVWTKLSGPATFTFADDTVGAITGTQYDGGNSRHNWADISANGGTSIFAVRYDAIDVDLSNKASHGGFYPATNPDRVNFFIVADELGTAEAMVSFNGDFAANSRLHGWDYIYDTWYYLKTDTAPMMTFTTKDAVKVEYAFGLTDGTTMVSTVSAFTGLTAAEGTYTVPLSAMNKADNNYGGTVIIRMTDKDGKYSYQLVKVAGVTVTVTNASNSGELIMPGDTVKLTFDGLYRSINKISGVFNPTTFYPRYTIDGNEVSGTLGQYQQMDNSSITLTVPEDIVFADGADETVLTATNGYVYGSMYSAANPFGTMYGMTDAGMGTNFNAVMVSFAFQRLADVEIRVYKKVWYNVELNITDADGKVDGTTVVLKGSDGAAIKPQEDGTYKLGYGSYSCSVTKDGYVCYSDSFKLGSADAASAQEGKLTRNVVLVKAAEGAWDGKTATEPAKDADGIYQIGTGAELAWFAQEVNKGSAEISAVLTKDIDLAGYNWTPIGDCVRAFKPFAGSFDGQGHKVYNLSVDYQRTTAISSNMGLYQGLFGWVDGSENDSTGRAVIQNLTVQGSVVISCTKNVTYAYSGGVIGRADYADITNVHSEVDVTVKRVSGNWYGAGGVVGGIYGGTNVKDCSNSGTIKGWERVGGIVGYINYGGKSTIVNCINSGAVTGHSYAAGVMGYIEGSNSSIVNCTNTGSVFCDGSGVAGIVASLSNGSKAVGCVNTGAIRSTGNYVGGIASWIANAEVSNCYNSGTITCSQVYGSVVGKVSSASAKITKCYYLAGTADKGIGSATNEETQTADSIAADAALVRVAAPEGAETGKDVTFSIYMNAANGLACAEMELNVTGGTITEIEQGSGLTLGMDGRFKGENSKMSFTGNTASAVNGILVATVTVRVDDFADEVVLTASSAVAGTSGETTDKNVTVMNAEGVKAEKVYTVSKEEFAPGLYLVTYTKNVPEGKSITCSDVAMLLADGGKTVTLVSSDKVGELKNSSFAVSDDAAVAVNYGDVNGNNKINIVDAQIALDVGKNVYKDSDKVSVAGLLAADVNHDGVVDAMDAYCIQLYVHYSAFTVTTTTTAVTG